ncbi:ABC transporter substrate-binding protein [Vibrio hannami]|uniref:ABC transporter substrate-binding protein n=1 Tax=Vibrio hannami TaxID=2717094 RepID=UPI00240E9DC0|nr:ABC transporter substrate-binding protein [Vibrio hannami]MDG3085103.1 ABC transporter substrate-binding protein [Vibrio hannami]
MFRYLLILLALAFAPTSYAYDKIVLLAPAAGDILIKLGAQDKVVGVTRSNHDFPDALKIGSHIKPNVELIKGLEPDLLIISSNRFFSDQMAGQIEADVVKYDPHTLKQILEEVETLGQLVDKQAEAKQLVSKLTAIQQQIKSLPNKPKVVFEVTESPFMVAGQRSIVNGIVTAAGGELLAPGNRKVVKFNVESVLFENPDFYLYQVGPMNKNPTPPLSRPNFNILDSKIVKVDQLEFSRATTHSFSLALEMNKRFLE